MKIIIMILIMIGMLYGEYTRNDNLATVYDSETGLTWQDDSNTKTIFLNWENAIDYCEDLVFAGYNDWRLPNYNELYMIMDQNYFEPAIHPEFTNTYIGPYWSSTSAAGSRVTTHAWPINFSYGRTLWEPKIQYKNVRCVRGELTLGGGNTPPTANAGADKSVQVNQTVSITGSGTDSDGTITAYEWSKGSTVLATTASFDYTPDTVGTDTLTLTVTDNENAIGTDSMNVTVTMEPPTGTAYADDFRVDTTSQYNIANTWTSGGTGSFTYDTANERVCVVTEDNVALEFSNDLPASTEGSFSIDFLPTQYYPQGGIVRLKLLQDANTYFLIDNTDGYGAHEVAKYVNGVKVDSVPFTYEYTQNINYTLTLTFSPTMTTIQAFGQTLTMSNNPAPIAVNSFSIETIQQDACFDNIVYSIGNE